MHRKDLLHSATRAFTITIAMMAAACAPTATTPVRLARGGPQLVPAPSSLVVSSGAPFSVEQTTSIYVDGNPAVSAIGEMLAAQIRKSTQFPVLVAPVASVARGGIILRLAPDRTAP